MPFSGQLGTANSMLGNIVLGFGGAQAFGQVTLNGVALNDIGDKYDLALGYDPGTGAATMYGYMLAATAVWKESTQLQDTQKLIQAASALATDRDFTFWPKVSQGDWSKGARQLIFLDPARFYQSNGVDTTKPGYLTLQPAASTTTYTMTGTYNTLPLVSDGNNWYLGISQGGHNLLIGNAAGITAYTVASNAEIIDMLYTPAGVVFGTATQGIWLVTPAGTATQVTTENIDQNPWQSLAYFGGNLYYIQVGSTTIRQVNVTTGGTPSNLVTISANSWEPNYTILVSTSTGLLYAKSKIGAGPGTNGCIIYTNTGSAETRVGDIPGQIRAGFEANGTVYLLCRFDQLSATAQDYTLMTYTSTVATGAILAILDDNRFAPADFLASDPSPTATVRASVDADGRNVYYAWPGMDSLRLDLVSGGVSQNAPTAGINAGGGFGQGAISAHRTLNVSGLGLVDVVGVGSTATVKVSSRVPTTGVIVTSYFDFGTPTIVKQFRGFEISLFSAIPQGASVTVSFGLDNATTFTPMQTEMTAATLVNCIFPQNTKASRVRYQISITSNSNGQSPIITSYATKASLARVWKTTVSCKRRQELRNGQEDDQAAQPQDLLANILGAYRNAGKCILFIPSPFVGPPYVELVHAALEDYEWDTTKPGTSSNEQFPFIQEGDCQLTLAEILG